MENLIRPLASAVAAAAVAVLHPALPAITLCTVMVCLDTFTAWRLGCRVRRAYGPASEGAGKLQSHRLGRALATLAKVYVLLLVAEAVNIVIAPETDVLRLCAGAVTAWQAVSILENESSCTTAKWPAWIKRYLADKVRRHLP